jgi:phosphoserine phosphatase
MTFPFEKFPGGNNGLLSNKIEFISKLGAGKLHLVLDFDRTLTQGKDGSGRDITTWHVLQRHIPEAARNKYWEFYNRYRPLEARNKMSVPEAIAWWSGVLNIYKDNNLKWGDVAKGLEIAMPARAGAKELFDVCAKKNIPTIIISAGIKDLIDLWCQKLGVSPSLVLSTELNFGPEGNVCGWDAGTLIHALNKSEMGHGKLEPIRERRPNAILVSDSIHDAGMVNAGIGSLKIIIDDVRFDDSPRSDDYYRKVFENFDLAINTGSLLPIAEFIKLL